MLQKTFLIWDKQDWISSVSSKQASYHALAEYHQSQLAKENKDFGEEIARLKVCETFLFTYFLDVHLSLCAYATLPTLFAVISVPMT